MIKKFIVILTVMLMPVSVMAHELDDRPGNLYFAADDKSQSKTQQKAEQHRQDHEKERVKAEKQKQDRCEKAGSALKTRSQKAAGHRDNINKYYLQVEERWQRLINRANASSVEATKLEESLAQFKVLRAQLVADLEAMRQLQADPARACGTDAERAAFKEQLKNAHSKVLDSAKKARVYRQETQSSVIVPLLKELAQAGGVSND